MPIASSCGKSRNMDEKLIVDVAAILGAILWPVLLMIVFLVYRKEIPKLTEAVLRRVNKFAFAGIEVQLAEVKTIEPAWGGPSNSVDLRHQARSTEINDSYVATFITQLRDAPQSEVAEVDLGQGEDWLSSRLYIMAILFARYKRVQALVFLDTALGVTRRYVGWADADTLRWALASRYPWLECAYANAYHAVQGSATNAHTGVAMVPPLGRVTDHHGRLGTVNNLTDVQPGIVLLQEFLSEIQIPPKPFPAPPSPHPAQSEEWVTLERRYPAEIETFEHATWLNSNHLAEILADDLHHAALREHEFKILSPVNQYDAVLSKADRYIALIDDVGRFKGMLNRCVLLGQAVRTMTETANESSQEQG